MGSPVVTVAGLRCVSARFVLPYTGIWFADLDLDPELVASVPPLGPVPIVIGTTPPVTLLGMIDPLGSGSFGATARMRVVGGRGGWAKSVPAQHMPSPGTTQVVYAQTAALVGEVCVVAVPAPAPENYVRLAGLASDVLRDEPSWWVDPTTGTTFVAPRPPAAPDLSIELMSWDAGGQVAEVRCDTLVVPGTIIVDPRIGGGRAIVRDVEHVIDASGSRAVCMCSSNSVSRLLVCLQTLVREHCKTGFLKIAGYRFVSDVTDATHVALQALDRDPLTGLASPYPDLLPITMWTGVAGITADLAPSTQVLVGFIDGDPQKPVVVGYSTLLPPVKLTLDAVAQLNLGQKVLQTVVDATAKLVLGQLAPIVNVGSASAEIALGGGVLPVARATDPVIAGPFGGTIVNGNPLVTA